MSGYRVLVLGGSGLFGGLLVQRMRSLPGLSLQLGSRRGAIPLDLDAPDFAARLSALRPQVVVHCAGPFQGQDYRVARACIAVGAHYIDIADGRDFVAGIGALEAEARDAGVMVCSGASSVPALSGAAADELAEDLSQVDCIDIGISPGNRTPRGLSTVRAILGYCGRPLPGGAIGWIGSWRWRYAAPVGERLLSPCDVPDLALLPGRYPGRPVVRFGAGLELPLLHRGMNALGWLGRLGLVRRWDWHAGWLKRVADALQGLGSDAGAMHVTVRGRSASGERVERAWELLATQGHGPHVPTLAVSALLRRLSQGWRPPAGARPCLGLLSTEEILAEADGLQIRAARVPSLYQQLMGETQFGRLPSAVQRFHALQGDWTLHGQVQTEAPAKGLARLAARWLRSPRVQAADRIEFRLQAGAHQERWTRRFPGSAAMVSRLQARRGELIERLGPVCLRFDLQATPEALRMRLCGMTLLGLPLPTPCLPTVVAEERGEGDRLHFTVSARLPLIGRVAAYQGHLELPAAGP